MKKILLYAFIFIITNSFILEVPDPYSIDLGIKIKKQEVVLMLLYNILAKGAVPLVLPLTLDADYILYDKDLVSEVLKQKIVKPSEIHKHSIYFDCNRRANYYVTMAQIVFPGIPVFRVCGLSSTNINCGPHSFFVALTKGGLVEVGGDIRIWDILYEINGG